MIFISRRKIVVLSLFITLLIFSELFSSSSQSPVFSQKPVKRIVLDAGHGFPDGGAIGMSGTIESTLNLKIATALKKILVKKGYEVIMTRSDDNSLSDKKGTISEKKQDDMKKRINIINTSGADIFVSIHMNKYSDSRYRGAQVIYSSNFIQSEHLANFVQTKLCTLTDNKSKRTHLSAPKSIFLLKNAEIPAVIVECGFLSNFEEERLLLTKKYQNEIAAAIADGIENYYKKEYAA